MDVISYALSKKYTEEVIDARNGELSLKARLDKMEQFQDHDTGKTYKYGFKYENGFLVFIFEEVV